MTDVLIIGDSIRSPDMRHAVPVAIGDPFLYGERDGRASVVVVSFERERVEALAMGLDPDKLLAEVREVAAQPPL